MRTSLVALSLFAVLAAVAPPRASGEDAKPAEPPALVDATKGDFPVLLEGTGVLEPVGAVEVMVDPKVWGAEWKVVEAREAGPVSKGDLLVRFDEEKIGEAQDNAERDLTIARAALAARAEDVSRAETATKQGLERAEHENAVARKSLDQFRAVDRDLRVKESEHSLQGTRDYISDQEEELAQLRKMYKSDDVVEETEEIVMRRAVRALDRTKLWMTFSTTRHKELVEIELPREERNLVLAVDRTTLELERQRAVSSPSLEQGRADFEKAKVALERQAEALKKLVADRERMRVVAPASGIAVTGSCVRGKWSAVDETARNLMPGESIKPRQVLYTIVVAGKVSYKTSVPEASALDVKPGQAVDVTPTAVESLSMKGKVARVSPVSTDGNYEVTVTLDGPDARLMPGLAAKSKILVAEKKAAVTVPAASVVTEGETKTVHVWADGKSAAKTIKTGATSAGRIEVVEGLSGGEKVLKSPPK
jgi:HlyD family secretion protein